jgi:drug/metabolite transporter (DMT)-like permease
MRLALLTALAMIAFAANSVLNRMAVGSGAMDVMSFALIRLLAGAGMLGLLLILRHRRGGALWAGWPGRATGVIGLLAYLIGFSAAYLALDAGMGALILFASVQVTMFAGALAGGEAVPPRRWLGAGLALSGLAVLLAPGAGGVPSLAAAAAMVCAGVGWGFYSLAGRATRDALGATAWNFLLSVPVALALFALWPAEALVTARGLWLAILSGAVTSGLGYALWYALVPALGAARAGVAQLTVPLIAAAGGLALMGEAVSLRFALAAALVLGGVGLASVQSGLRRR